VKRQRSKAADNPLALMNFNVGRTGMFLLPVVENLLLLHSAWLISATEKLSSSLQVALIYLAFMLFS